MLPIGGACASADDDNPEKRQRLPSRLFAPRSAPLSRDQERGSRGHDCVNGRRQHVAMSNLNLSRRAPRSHSGSVVLAHVRMPVGVGLSTRELLPTIKSSLFSTLSRRVSLQCLGSSFCDLEGVGHFPRRISRCAEPAWRLAVAHRNVNRQPTGKVRVRIYSVSRLDGHECRALPMRLRVRLPSQREGLSLPFILA